MAFWPPRRHSMCRPGLRVSTRPGLPRAVEIFSTNLEQDTHTLFVCLLFVESGRARFLRSRSALASTVSVRSLGGGGVWGWSGRSGLVWSGLSLFRLLQDAFLTLFSLGPVRGPAFLAFDAFLRDNRLPVQCRDVASCVASWLKCSNA